jgi:hypothetical protein
LSAADPVVADEVEEKPERSIREELEAARDEVVARETNDDRNESVREVGGNARGSGSDPEVVPASIRQPEGERARGADGKFTPREQPALEQASQAVSTPPVALPAPTGWKAEEKALWAKVPAEVQHVINRREQDIARLATAQDEVRLIGNNFISAANEYAPILQARGITPVNFFKEALGIVSQLGHPDLNVRAQMLRQLAQVNGVDPRVLAGAAPNAPGQQPPNLPIDQLVQRQVNEAFQARTRQETEARERAEMQATNSEIEVFRSKTVNGQPAYPYFDHVTSLMASILGGGAATGLEEAYQLAVKAHPETSGLIAQAEAAKAKQAEDKRRTAEAKRRAGGSLRGSAGGASPSTNGAGKSIRDELKSAFEDARGRF